MREEGKWRLEEEEDVRNYRMTLRKEVIWKLKEEELDHSVCRTDTYNFIISHTHQFIIQYNYISGLHVSTVFSHHQALLRTSPMLI